MILEEEVAAFGFTDEQWGCYTVTATAAAGAARSLDQAERRVEELRESGAVGLELDQALRAREAAAARLARLDRDCERLEAAHLADLTASAARQLVTRAQAHLDEVDTALRRDEQRHRSAVLRDERDEALAELRACARLRDRARQRDAQRAARAEQLAEFCR